MVWGNCCAAGVAFGRARAAASLVAAECPPSQAPKNRRRGRAASANAIAAVKNDSTIGSTPSRSPVPTRPAEEAGGRCGARRRGRRTWGCLQVRRCRRGLTAALRAISARLPILGTCEGIGAPGPVDRAADVYPGCMREHCARRAAATSGLLRRCNAQALASLLIFPKTCCGTRGRRSERCAAAEGAPVLSRARSPEPTPMRTTRIGVLGGSGPCVEVPAGTGASGHSRERRPGNGPLPQDQHPAGPSIPGFRGARESFPESERAGCTLTPGGPPPPEHGRVSTRGIGEMPWAYGAMRRLVGWFSCAIPQADVLMDFPSSRSSRHSRHSGRRAPSQAVERAEPERRAWRETEKFSWKPRMVVRECPPGGGRSRAGGYGPWSDGPA